MLGECCCGGPEEADEEQAAEIKLQREQLLSRLEELGLRLHKMVGRSGAELYVAVGASQRVLEYHAQALRLKVPLNPSPIVLKRSRELGIRPATVRVPFSMANREAFRSTKEEGEPFEFRTRLKAEIIRAAIGASTALTTVLLARLNLIMINLI